MDFSNESLENVVGRSWIGLDEDGEEILTIQRRDGKPFDAVMLDTLKPYIDEVNDDLQRRSDHYDEKFGGIGYVKTEHFHKDYLQEFTLNPRVVPGDRRSWSYNIDESDGRLLGTIDVYDNDEPGDDLKSKSIVDKKTYWCYWVYVSTWWNALRKV